MKLRRPGTRPASASNGAPLDSGETPGAVTTAGDLGQLAPGASPSPGGPALTAPSPGGPALTAPGAATASSTGPVPAEPDPALVAERDRLTERFAVMQTELGGLFYEMAIRDYVRLDVLMPKAAALQRVDAELAQVEHLLAAREAEVGGHCPQCGTVYARGAAFCSQCAHTLAA